MSGDGRPALEVPDATGLRLAVAATRWHAEIVDVLLERALAVAGKAGVEQPTVVRVPVATLADPVNRFQVRHPSGYVGPAFSVAGLIVWGFTGGLLSTLLHLGGWERPWNASRVRDLDEAWAAVRAEGREVAES